MGSADLAKAQAFHIHKLAEVVMVDKDEDFILIAVLVVALSLKGFNNSQELLTMRFISRFYGDYLS